MAVIRPFAAYRPDPEVVSEVAALPYDVYNRKEAKEEVARTPKSFLAIDRPISRTGTENSMPAMPEMLPPTVIATSTSAG